MPACIESSSTGSVGHVADSAYVDGDRISLDWFDAESNTGRREQRRAAGTRGNNHTIGLPDTSGSFDADDATAIVHDSRNRHVIIYYTA